MDGSQQLTAYLARAQRRLWTQAIVRHAARGAALGALAGVVIALVAWAAPVDGLRFLAITATLLGLVVGLIVALIRRPSLQRTARAIDDAGQLKDRVHSALQFSHEQPDDFRLLQLTDALDTLAQHQIRRLLPWRWPSEGTWAGAAMATLVVALLLVPTPQPAGASPVGPPAAVLVEAHQLEDDLAILEQVAEETDSRELKELSKKLHKAVHEMLQESRTSEEAMVHLARMTSMVNAAAARFDPLLLEQSLKSLADGLRELEAFGPASELLKEGKLAEAAQAMNAMGEAIEAGRREMPRSGGLEQSRLTALAHQAGSQRAGEISESLGRISSGIQSGSKSEYRNGVSRLAGTIGEYSRRISTASALRSQLMRLSERRENLSDKNGYCSACKNGGPCKGGSCTSLKRDATSISNALANESSRRANADASAQLYGKATGMSARRAPERITGMIGEGDSETETGHSPDAQQSAGAQYRNIYARYSKLSDAAMEEEAVPLAHRRMIKKYFELIHPDRVDAEAVPATTALTPEKNAADPPDTGKPTP